MITDTYILEEFEEHELFMDMETCPLRLIQLDLHRFGLGKLFFILVQESKVEAEFSVLTIHPFVHILIRQARYYSFGGKTFDRGWNRLALLEYI